MGWDLEKERRPPTMKSTAAICNDRFTSSKPVKLIGF
jgi:hypothetical protein